MRNYRIGELVGFYGKSLTLSDILSIFRASATKQLTRILGLCALVGALAVSWGQSKSQPASPSQSERKARALEVLQSATLALKDLKDMKDLEDMEENSDLEDMEENSEPYFQKASLYAEVAFLQAKAGGTTQARQNFAKATEVAQSNGDADTLVGIAWKQSAVGLKEDAKETLKLARQIAERDTMPSYQEPGKITGPFYPLYEIASLQIEMGLKDEAKKTLAIMVQKYRQVSDPMWETIQLAEIRAQLGQEAQARQNLATVLRKISSGEWKGSAEGVSLLANIAEVQSKLGQASQAR